MTATLPMTSLQPGLCGLPLYALINAFGGEPALLGTGIHANSFDELRTKRAQAWGGRPIELAESEQPANDVLRLPYLVALEGAHDPLYAQLLQFAEHEAAAQTETGKGAFAMGAFIETALRADRLMQRLQCMWSAPVNGARPYLQVADPRCFETLAYLFGEPRMCRWLGPIARWHVRQRSGHWATHLGAADESFIKAEEDLYRREQRLAQFEQLPARAPMDTWQYRKLERHSLAVALALTQAQRHPQGLDAHAQARAWQALDHALERHLSHDGDLTTYIRHAVLSPAFAASPEAQACLAAARLAPGTLGERLDALAAVRDRTNHHDARH